ncbi:hypothetical protein V5E97_35510 [Singulisphaera sp. Ch08]|uniref:Transposase IS701-like DDE domain-containing protein n=1 Tax=Singulisphaera sp. Ch08 TaxID=3120278 RepID=A0AAU7CER9_9BACT
MVAHELQSGCALIPELGAKYGPNNTSEARQAAAIGLRIPTGSIVMADAGFGIFQVAHAGTFSPPMPGPVDSADTLGGQGSPRSRSKALPEKDFCATYCLRDHY